MQGLEERQRTEVVCPFCREDLAGLSVSSCSECGTPSHRVCVSEFGGCSTLGCVRLRRPKAAPAVRALPATRPRRPVSLSGAWVIGGLILAWVALIWFRSDLFRPGALAAALEMLGYIAAGVGGLGILGLLTRFKRSSREPGDERFR